MHHIGLARSPLQQRQRMLSPVANSFAFSSPLFSNTSPSPAFTFPSQSTKVTAPVTTASQKLQTVTQSKPRSPTRSQDNKDVLVERLYDILDRLEDEDEEDGLDDKIVSRIHDEMHNIESILGTVKRRARDPSKKRMTLAEVRLSEEDSYSERPSTPDISKKEGSLRSRRRRRLYPRRDSDEEQDSGVDVEALKSKDHVIHPEHVVKLARAADELAEKLATAVAELHARREESDQIHDLLVTRAERATERILFLEYKIAEMEDDFGANQSELKFLRIQLQAIEAQCSPYINEEGDEELEESIANWKIDWEDINRKSRARRRKEEGDLGVLFPALSRGHSGEIPLRRSYSNAGEETANSLRVVNDDL